MNSDGCTWVPDFWFHECCVAHDFGGTDWELAQCIYETAPQEYALAGLVLALAYYLGLKLFGWIYRKYGKKDGNDDNRLE